MGGVAPTPTMCGETRSDVAPNAPTRDLRYRDSPRSSESPNVIPSCGVRRAARAFEPVAIPAIPMSEERLKHGGHLAAITAFGRRGRYVVGALVDNDGS